MCLSPLSLVHPHRHKRQEEFSSVSLLKKLWRGVRPPHKRELTFTPSGGKLEIQSEDDMSKTPSGTQGTTLHIQKKALSLTVYLWYNQGGHPTMQSFNPKKICPRLSSPEKETKKKKIFFCKILSLPLSQTLKENRRRNVKMNMPHSACRS